MSKNFIEKFFDTQLLSSYLIFGSMFFSGCSAQRWLASHGDTILKYKIGTYVDLSDDQEKKVDTFVEKFWKSLGQKWLEKFSSEYGNFADGWSDGMSAEAVDSMLSGIRIISLEMWAKEGFAASKLLMSLTDLQLNELAESLEESNEKYLEGLENSKEEFREDYLERLWDGFEEFYGSLENNQKRDLAENFTLTKKFQRQRLASRRSAQTMFVSEVRDAKTIASLQKKIASWIEKPELMRESKFQLAYIEYRDAWRQKFSKRDLIASEVQRQYAQKKITKLFQDVRKGLK